ncbi:MAG TPA: metal ABC transporter permease [Nevskia sp.]|jgi:zinc/manganese transport system permease protein|nr:metal ABC transporter permease [Nevskia sp.]
MSSLGFDWSLLAPPLAAGLVVSATHVTLGREVLRRGIIFIDLTIAQIAALGVIAVEAAGYESQGWTLQLAAGAAALLASALLSWTERKLAPVQEALIGCLYVVAACVSILLLAHNPHGGEHLTELLAGQILWVSYSQVWPVALLYAAILAAWWLGARKRPGLFYPLFAINVTASVQLVGVYLVFATLILPALAARGLGMTRGLLLGYAVGAAGYALGLWLSVPLDLPSGPLIVCVLAALALVAGVLRALSGSSLGGENGHA